MKIRLWLDMARYVSFPQSLLPGMLALALAYGTEGFSWPIALLAVVGAVFAHFGFNILDDYFDYRNNDGKVREQLANKGMRSRIAKCPHITSGQVTVRQTLYVAITYLAIAAFMSFIVLSYRQYDLRIIGIVAAALVLGYSYSGKPLPLGYYGLGELIIGIMFGPLLMSGVYIAASGVFDYGVLLFAVAAGMLVMNIVYTHSVMDVLADEAIGKMTFARLLRSKAAMLTASALLIFGPFILIVFAVEVFAYSPWNYLAFILLPWGIALFRSLFRFVYGKATDDSPKWWMGPMERWEHICASGIQWFMIRWYLARNLLSMFCLILILVNIFT